MSFSADYRTLRNCKIYSQSLYLKISVNAETNADATKARDSEIADGPITGVSPYPIVERVKANVKPMNLQISTLTHLINRLIQDNSALNSPTVGSPTQCTQREPSTGSQVGNSRVLPGTVIGSTGFPLDTQLHC